MNTSSSQRLPQNLSINDFTYPLMDDKIAKFPLPIRDQSKLLIYKDNHIEQSLYSQLPDYLPENTLLIFNNTKVVEARLLFQKENGSVIELFCLEPADIYADITTAMLQKQKVLWKCLVGGAKKWKSADLEKEVTTTAQNKIVLHAHKVEKQQDWFLIEFSWQDENISFAEILHFMGQIPLPPYLNRAVQPQDKESYQTVYAKYDGSVAAPTAGLHFTQELMQNLQKKQIKETYVTLHVGAGTFKPVKSATMEGHEMHAEFMEVTIAFIELLIQSLSNKIVVVGTTSMRTVESLYWMGVKLMNGARDIEIKQWDPYHLPQYITPTDALTALKQYLQSTGQHQLIARTQIIIAPGYQMKIVSGLITNFHQPKSTLLLLVAALVGDAWRSIYNYALAHDFRFLSYGDGSLLWNNQGSPLDEFSQISRMNK